MQYPTPLASMAGTIVPEDLPSVAASYEAALFADLDQALATLPHDRCAVQWDVAVEFGLLEGGFGPGSGWRWRRSLYFALVPYHPADQADGTTAEQVRLIDTWLAASRSGERE